MSDRLKEFENTVFDVVVIGGGIYGAALTWAAARRGLKTALIEQADFGHASSSSSLKIMHGGLRYLQQLDFKRMRDSIRARRQAFILAPHLVHPASFMVPTVRFGLQHKLLMTAAFLMNDTISWDRNQGVPAGHRIPRGRILPHRKLNGLLDGVACMDVTGAALWSDGFVENTERFTYSLVKSAALEGAVTANYVRAEELIRHDGCVVGVRVRDLVSDTPTEIRGNITVNAGGPWLGELTGGAPDNRYPWGWTRGYNIIVRRRFFDDYGVGLEGRADDYDSASVVKRQQRNFFFAPWRSGTIIGTIYRRYTDMPGKSRLDPEEIESFIREVNGLYPPAELTMEDVTYAHVGVLPAPLKMTPGDNVDPARDTQVVDGRKAGLDGYYAVRGVKYTTAIEVAERLATQWAGAAAMPVSRSLYGGERLISVGEVDGAARELKLKLDADVAENLAVQYGARFGDVLAQIGDQADLAQPLAAGVRTIGAQVLHAVRKEQALHLSDAVLRRTALGSFRYPGRPAVEKCAALMAGELHWDESRKASEIQALHDHYENRGVAHAI